MTPGELIAATGCSTTNADRFASYLTDAMNDWQINTPARQAAFLAQIAHESGRFIYVREIWGPTAAQQRYEGRADLGNTQPGDGFRFLGRGLIQITGRANYKAVGDALALPLLDVPALLELPEHASDSAAWFWATRGCNELADVGDFEHITRKINGGLNGINDRLALWDRAQSAIA